MLATQARSRSFPAKREKLGEERRGSVLLVGFMGAGKSTVGRALAAELACGFEDLDERIERREGQSVAEIFRHFGERDFRRLEHEALADLLGELQGGVNRVVALGGGAFVEPGNANLIAESGLRTVFLDAPVEELWRRCCSQAKDEATERPLLHSLEEFRKLYALRRPKYLAADVHQETAGKDIAAVLEEILEALSRKQGGKEVR